MQPLEVLRPGMQREFIVAEEEDEFGEIILSLAAIEVGNTPSMGESAGSKGILTPGVDAGRSSCSIPVRIPTPRITF